MEFKVFQAAIQRQFNKMKEMPLFRSSVTKDDMWDKYLASFPEGTNPIYKERTEHDCNCCKQFIRAVGDMVAVDKDLSLISIWDCQVGGFYQEVANAMAAFVKSGAIENVFLHTERTAGTDSNRTMDEGKVITWNHFFIQLPNNLMCAGADLGTWLGGFRSTYDVAYRGLNEITIDSCEVVLELIAQNSLYRGTEHKAAVESFLKIKKKFDKISADKKSNFVWSSLNTNDGFAARIRNTVIGTLLVDLSDGKEMEDAVKAFEFKVAPANYKRPTALVTKAMIENAKKKIEELGIMNSLDRRYAVLEDITINNVLFADRTARKVIDNVFDELSSKMSSGIKNLEKVEEVSIDKFLKDILPKAQSIEALLENKHYGNLVSLIAPVDLTAKNMFKWDNAFSWSYNGDIADSMRQRVQDLGGRVDGVLRFTHSWNHPEVGRNASLMDLHVFMPGSSAHKDGCHDSYPSGRRVGWNHRHDVHSKGKQDVDYTDAAPEGYVPVENITFPTLSLLPEGTYTFKIHNWNCRPITNSGFKAEIEFEGQIFQYDYPKPLKHKEWVTVAKATLKNGKFEIQHMLESSTSSKEVWNLPTQTFHKVKVAMFSPNFWNGKGVGNQHIFFMLEGCKNSSTARGFYNEFLNSELDQHRKVLEMVGSKMQTANEEHQLSGLGFSTTQRNDITLRVKGAFNRVIKVIF